MNSRQWTKLRHAARKLGIQLPIVQTLPARNPAPTREEKKRLRATFRIAGSAIGALVTLVTLAGGYLAFRSDITVEPYASKDQRLPFSEMFYVQNIGPFSIYNVQPQCQIIDVRNPGFRFHDLSITNPEEVKEELAANARTNVTCNLIGGRPVPYEKLAIEIWVTYRPSFWRTKCKKSAFDGVPAIGGTFIWSYQGTSDCPSK